MFACSCHWFWIKLHPLIPPRVVSCIWVRLRCSPCDTISKWFINNTNANINNCQHSASHRDKMMAVNISSNHWYVTFLNVISTIATFLLNVSYHMTRSRPDCHIVRWRGCRWGYSPASDHSTNMHFYICKHETNGYLFFLGNFLGPLLWLYWQIRWRFDRKQDEREGERQAAKGPGPGVEPWSAALRTKPLYAGRLLYQLSYTVLHHWKSSRGLQENSRNDCEAQHDVFQTLSKSFLCLNLTRS